MTRPIPALFALFLAAASHPTIASAQAVTLEADARAFGARESIRSIDIAPGGRQVAIVEAAPGRSSILQLVDLASLDPVTIMRSSGTPQSFRSCNFAGDQQLICRYGGNLDVEGVLAGFSRLITLDTKGANMKPLGQQSSMYDASLRQFDGEILDWLPGQSAVLMARNYIPESGNSSTRMVRSSNGVGVDRIDIPSLTSKVIEAPRKDVSSYFTDGRGLVRVMVTSDFNNALDSVTGKRRVYYRSTGARDWRPLGVRDDAAETGIEPLAVDAESNSLFLLRRLDGRKALYRVKLDDSAAETLVASNPKVDIDDVVRVGHGQRVIGYTFSTDSRDVIYFDPEFTNLHNSLTRAVPGHPQVDFVASSADGDKLLIFASGDTQPGSYYLYERASKHLNELALARPALEFARSLRSSRSPTKPPTGPIFRPI